MLLDKGTKENVTNADGQSAADIYRNKTNGKIYAKQHYFVNIQ